MSWALSWDLTWALRLPWAVAQEPIHPFCHPLAARLVEPHQGLPLARMGGDPFPRQVPHRLDAASPRVTHRRRAPSWPAARAVVAIAGAHPVPFQFPASRSSDIEVLQAHQAPCHKHR